MNGKRFLRSVLAAGACSLILAGAAAAQSRTFDVPDGDLRQALDIYVRQSGVQLVYSVDAVRGARSHGAHGPLSLEDALKAILSGTSFVAQRDSSGAFAIVRRTSDPVVGRGQADAEAGAVAEVIVTANKRSQREQNVPTSITAETGAMLEHRGATRLEDIIDNTPGLSNPGSGSGNSTNLTIRGVTTGTDLGLKQSTVALLFDDIPVDVAGQGGGATNLRIVDIERVEVLRGPQGTLFGAGSLSGAVRYITNKPDFEQYSGSAEVTGAATQTGAPSYWGDLVANLPVIQDKLAIRAVGYGYHEGGWIDDLMTGKKDTNFTDTYGGRVAISAKPNERFLGTLTIAYQDSKDNEPGVSYYQKPANTGHSGQVYDGIYPVPNDINTALYNAYVQYDFDTVSVVSSSTYQKRNASSVGHDYFFAPLVTAIVTGFTDIVNGQSFDYDPVDEDNYTEEFRISSRGTGPLKWTVGGFYLNSSTLGGQHVTSPLVVPFIGGDNIVDLLYRQHQTELSGFGEATYTIADKLDLTAGVRVSDLRVSSDTITGGFIPVFSESPAAYVTTHFAEHDTPVNPRFSIAYRPNTDLTLYAQAARGFRVGGINQTSGVGGRATPPTYNPDHLWNYEVGAKGQAFDHRLSFSAAAYYIDWTNIQISLANNLGDFVGNAGQAGLYGVEFQADAKPVEWLTLGASLSLSHNTITKNDPTIVRPSTGTVGVSDGDLLPASPEVQASAYAQYNFDVMTHPAYFRVGAHYLGSEWTDFAKTGTKFGDFATADLRTGVVLDRVELIAFLNNVGDSQGATGATDAQIAGPVVIQHQGAFRIRPRTVGVTVRASF